MDRSPFTFSTKKWLTAIWQIESLTEVWKYMPLHPTFKTLYFEILVDNVSRKNTNSSWASLFNSLVISFFLLDSKLLSIVITSSANQRKIIKTIFVWISWKKKNKTIIIMKMYLLKKCSHLYNHSMRNNIGLLIIMTLRHHSQA